MLPEHGRRDGKPRERSGHDPKRDPRHRRITGSFTPTEVEILSKMLRTGALPASLNPIEDERRRIARSGLHSPGVTAAIAGFW